MPLSAGLFKSEHKNPVPQCPPRLHVQFLSHVLWSRMPNQFLKVDVSRISERQGWLVQCLEPLQFMSLHIPEENRLALSILACVMGTHPTRPLPRGPGVGCGNKMELKKYALALQTWFCIFHIRIYLNDFITETQFLCRYWRGDLIVDSFFPHFYFS